MEVKTKNVINLEYYEFTVKGVEIVHSFTVINFKALFFNSPQVYQEKKTMENSPYRKATECSDSEDIHRFS